jgi:hypothetical protein
VPRENDSSLTNFPPILTKWVFLYSVRTKPSEYVPLSWIQQNFPSKSYIYYYLIRLSFWCKNIWDKKKTFQEEENNLKWRIRTSDISYLESLRPNSNIQIYLSLHSKAKFFNQHKTLNTNIQHTKIYRKKSSQLTQFSHYYFLWIGFTCLFFVSITSFSIVFLTFIYRFEFLFLSIWISEQ